MSEPAKVDGLPAPFVLRRAKFLHHGATLGLIGLAAALGWVAIDRCGWAWWPAAGVGLATAALLAFRAWHDLRLYAEDARLLRLDENGLAAPRLFEGVLPWSQVRGALCGQAGGGFVLRVFADNRGLSGLDFRAMSDVRFDRFDLALGGLKLCRSRDYAAKGETMRAVAACNLWVAAAARARGDEAAARWAERFAKAMGEPGPARAREPKRLYRLASIARTRGITSRA